MTSAIRLRGAIATTINKDTILLIRCQRLDALPDSRMIALGLTPSRPNVAGPRNQDKY